MAGTATRSAAPPYGSTPATRWPARKPWASSTTVPATSTPRVNGSSGLSWYSPLLSSRSGNETPTRCTSMSTSSGPAVGSGRSTDLDRGRSVEAGHLGCTHGAVPLARGAPGPAQPAGGHLLLPPAHPYDVGRRPHRQPRRLRRTARASAPRQRGTVTTGRGRSSTRSTTSATRPGSSSTPENEREASGSSSLSNSIGVHMPSGHTQLMSMPRDAGDAQVRQRRQAEPERGVLGGGVHRLAGHRRQARPATRC